ncbi:MAG: hypothetical protein LAO05_18145 [Acidobacteriia bacterium]|nr:hypothetical protein [Terriglobia bacterium]
MTTSAVGDLSNPDLFTHWPSIAAVGVEKSLPSLIDFGRTMHLLSLSQEPHLTDTGRDTIAHGIAELEAKYSVHIRRPEDDLPKAAHVAILFNGFAGEAAAALDALGWTHVRVGLTFDPLQLAEDQRILLIPSGGLYGTAGSADLKARLAAYVQAGGTLIVMAQMHGEDFTTMPVPDGETLTGYGWFEDQSCWGGSVTIAAAHPLTSALTDTRRDVNVDGFFDRWPSQANLLLRKTNGAMPVLLTYPLGAGRVLMTTVFEDWARTNGRSSAEGQALLNGFLQWGVEIDRELPRCHFDSPCTVAIPVTLRNLTEAAGDTVVWHVTDGRMKGAAGWTESVALAPGESRSANVNVVINIWGGDSWSLTPGIYSLTYELQDSTRSVDMDSFFGPPKPWLLQPDGTVGRFVVEDWPDSVTNAPKVELGLTVDSECALPDTYIPVHISLRNDGETAFAGFVALTNRPRPPQQVPVVAAPHVMATVDALVGPLHLTTGHDGMAGGGSIQADLYADGGSPLASVVKYILNNPQLLDVSFESSQMEAGVGDELTTFGHIANQSMGETNLRTRVVFTNYYNSNAPQCPQVKTDWRETHLGQGEQTPIGESYTVPAACNGLIAADLMICTPGQPCWDSGDGGSRRGSAKIALPGTRVELTVGEFDVVPGPAFRLPIRVRNIGPRPVTAGEVGVTYWGLSNAPEVRSTPFDIEAGAETTILLDLPIPAGGPNPSYKLVVGYLDAYWGAFEDRVANSDKRLYHDISYGGQISVTKGFVADAGSEAINASIQIQNRSSAARHFALSLDQDALGFHETRMFDIGALQTITTAVTVPLPSPQSYGSWKLRARLRDGALIATDLNLGMDHFPPFVDVAAVPDAAAYPPGATANVSVQLFPGRLARPFPGTLEVTCDRWAFTESRTVTLESLQKTTEKFSIGVPSDFGGGVVLFQVRFHLPDGRETMKDGSLMVPAPFFKVTPLQTNASAGDEVAYEVSNSSVTPGTCSMVWTLRDGFKGLAEESREVKLAAGETARTTFTVPTATATGAYTALVRWGTSDGNQRVLHDLAVDGTEAGLEVGTGRPAYTTGQSIDGWAKVTNGAAAFPGATLALKVVAPELCDDRLDPWGIYQGGSARMGGSPHRSYPPQAIRSSFCFYSAASLPGTDVPIATASGDLNEDGADDLVALFPATEGLTMTVNAGPTLAKVASVALPGSSRTASLSAVDADGDEHLEIVQVDTGDGSALAVRCFDRTLHVRWSVLLPLAGDPGDPFPAGGPIAADIDGSGLPVVLASSGRDVAALEHASGAVRWQMAAVNPDLDGWHVTGIAAADVDGDGLAEVVVGLRVPGTPDSGAVVLLDAHGHARWLHSTAYPITGAPILVGGGGSRVALVQTPDDQRVSSSLILLSVATGAVIAESADSFRSLFEPAAADVNGDGNIELAVAAGDATCPGCAKAVLMFTSQAVRLWSTPLGGRPTGSPALLDMDASGTPDVLVDYVAPGARDGIGCFKGSDGRQIGFGYAFENPPSHALPLLITSSTGGCIPGIVSGRKVVKATYCGGPGVRAQGTANASEGEILWRWEGVGSLAPAQVWDVPQTFSTGGRMGSFLLVGDLRNEAGQAVAHSESSFSVVSTTAPLLNLDPLSTAYAPNVPLHAGGTVRNAGSAAIQVVVAFQLDGVESARQTISVATGATASFSQTLTMPGVGSHTLAVTAWPCTSPSLVSKLQLPFEVVMPAADVTVVAPAAVGPAPFTVVVHLSNPTRLPLTLEVGLDPIDGPQEAFRSVALAAQSSTDLPFQRQLTGTTTFVARVTGDVAHQTSVEVQYQPAPEPSFAGPLVRPAGDAVLALRLANATDLPWQGDLSWSLSGATTDGGTLPAVVEPHSLHTFDLPVTLRVGASTLRLVAGTVTREATLTAYLGALGRLAASVPASSAEGETIVTVHLANLLGETASFHGTIAIANATTGALATTEARCWSLDAGQPLDELIPLYLAAGTYSMATTLEGAPTGEPTQFTVFPGAAAEMEVTVQPVDPEGMLPLSVIVRNAGAHDVTGTVSVEGTGADIQIPSLTVAAGSSATEVLAFDPDRLPAGDLPLEVRFTLATGEVLATRSAVLGVARGAPVLGSAPTSVATPAGGSAAVHFNVTNRGTRTAHYELELDVNGGAVHSASAEGNIRGHETRDVLISVPIPGDLPSGVLQAEYTLVGRDVAETEGRTVASGSLPIVVQGLDVMVAASLDRDHVQPGEVVSLSLAIDAPGLRGEVPLAARVTYPPFGERREFQLPTGGTKLQFQVPIAQPGGEIGFAILHASGRALYLDSLEVSPGGGPVEITLDRAEARPGESVTLGVTLRVPGTLELFGLDHSASLTNSGTETFLVPGGLSYGRYPILWTFYGGGAGAGVLNGELLVRVRGPRVRITALHVQPGRTPGEVTVGATVTSDSEQPASAKVWLVGPSGGSKLLLEQSVTLGSDQAFDLQLPLRFAPEDPGTQTILLALVGQDGTELAEAAAALDAGGAKLQ